MVISFFLTRFPTTWQMKSEQEKFQWVLTAIVFVVVFIGAFIYFFASNCIFEWPIRWDIKTCWSEQIQPAKNEAIEKAANFMP